MKRLLGSMLLVCALQAEPLSAATITWGKTAEVATKNHTQHRAINSLRCCAEQLAVATLRLIEAKELDNDADLKATLLSQLNALEQDETATQIQQIHALVQTLVTTLCPTHSLVLTLDANDTDALIIDTERMVKELQNYLATRGMNPVRKALRSIADKITPYQSYLLVVGVPLGIYAAYYATYSAAGKLYPNKPSNKKITNEEDAAKTEDSAKAKQSALQNAKEIFNKAVAVVFVTEFYDYLKKNGAKDVLTRGTDFAKKMVARVLGRPFRDSNPGSSPKVKLNAIAAPESARQRGALVAQNVALEEVISKMGGQASFKTVLVRGDLELANEYAEGIADEISRVSKANGGTLRAKVVKLSIAKLIKEDGAKGELEKIRRYNQSCVIVLQDLQWLATLDDETRARTASEIISAIKGNTKPGDAYAFVGHTTDLKAVNPLLRAPGLLENNITLDPSADPLLADACVQRVEQIFSINITGPLRQQLVAYVTNRSFAHLKSLMSRFYTASLPEIGLSSFNEEGLAAELKRTLCEENMAGEVNCVQLQ